MNAARENLERMAQIVCDQLLEKLGRSQTRWSYFELTRAGSDDLLARLFLQRYEAYFGREKNRIAQVPPDWPIQYTSEQAHKMLDKFVDDLKKQWFVDRSELESILRETVSKQVQFIIMPLATVESLCFESAAACTVDRIVSVFRQFEKYRYYPDALEKYAQAKGIGHLTRGQLRLLITEINQSLFGVDGLENVLKVSGLIMKELNDLQGVQVNSIDIGILMMAFADRSLHDFEVALNIEKELGSETINLYGLRQVLNRFALLKDKKTGAPAGEEKPAAVVPKVPAKPKDTTGVIIDKVLAKEESGEVIDLRGILAGKDPTAGRLRPPTGEQKAASSAMETPDDVTGEFIKEELVESFSDDTAAIKLLALKEADRLVPIETLITEKDEKIFLKKIFFDDRADYRGFVNHLNRTKTWKEAINVLDEKLFANKVDPYCKEAIRMSDIVYTRYYPPESTDT